MKHVLLLAALLATSYAAGQAATMELSHGSGSIELDRLSSFQNIHKQKVLLTGEGLEGKSYRIVIKEFKASELVRTDTLFDGSESSDFNIAGDSASFDLFAQTEGNTFKIQIMTDRFSSKKLSYETYPINRDYTLKDFLGEKRSLGITVGEPFYAFAVITPTIRKDGSGSYCEVAQSDTDPEQFGTKYSIPHYFLVQITIK